MVTPLALNAQVVGASVLPSWYEHVPMFDEEGKGASTWLVAGQQAACCVPGCKACQYTLTSHVHAHLAVTQGTTPMSLPISRR
jgi:hypothetical protein